MNLKITLGKIAVYNDLLEKELASLNPIRNINDGYSRAVLSSLQMHCQRATKLFDNAFGDKAEEMGEIYDAIETTINERVTYD